MDTQYYYALTFCGFQFHERKLVRTHLPVGEVLLPDLLETVKASLSGMSFNPVFGFIKEALWHNDEPHVLKSSNMRRNKKQAFILKKKEDKITRYKHTYFLNNKKIAINLGMYEAHILEIGA